MTVQRHSATEAVTLLLAMFPPRQVLEPASCRPCCVGYHAVACYAVGYHAAPERLSALRPLRCIEPSAAFGGWAQPMVHRTIKGESHSTGRRCARIRLAAPTRGPRWILGLELKWILCFRCSCTAVRWGMQVTGSVKIAAQLLQVRGRQNTKRRAVFANTQWLTVPRLSRWTPPASRASSSSRRITTVTPQF